MGSQMKNGDKTLEDTFLLLSITLIGAFVFVFSKTPTNNILEKYFSMVSVISISLAILSLAWFRFRATIREKLFETSEKRIREKHIHRVIEFCENIVKPFIKIKTKQEAREIVAESKSIEVARIQLEKLLDKDRISKDVELEAEKYDGVISSMAESWNYEMRECYDKIYLHPLNERGSKMKHTLDIFCWKLRYLFFCLGMLSFVVTVCLRIANS